MGFRNPIATATAVDTGHGLGDAGVRLYQDLTFPATPAGVAEWRTGLMQRNATAILRGGGSGGSAFTLDGGASAGEVDAGRLVLSVESLPTGGYGSAARLKADRITLDGKLDTTTAAPTYSTASFVANPTSALALVKGADAWVRMRGLARLAVASSNLAGKWFDLPAGFRPVSTVFGLVYIEGGGIASVQIDPAGVVTGLALLIGGYPIPTPRYFSFDLSFSTT
jgi:hypothetical protein